MTDLLDIPAFLRRPYVKGQSLFEKVTRPKTTRMSPNKKPGAGWVTVNLSGEASRVGTGRRKVKVLSEGHKWVFVRYWPGGPNGYSIRQKFRAALWPLLVVPDA